MVEIELKIELKIDITKSYRLKDNRDSRDKE